MLSTIRAWPRLADYCAPQCGKDNNFNLLRMMAAMAVLYGHCYALLRLPEPLGATLGISLGSIAVDIFFVSSGFLVGASLFQRQSVLDYLVARCFRIFPALWVMLILVVFVLGASLTSNAEYFHDPSTLRHFWKSATLMTGIDFYLPGVFETNPFAGVVNGSLWSMVYEITMYILLLICWMVCRLCHRSMRWPFAVLMTAVAWYGTYWIAMHSGLFVKSQFLHLSWMFFCGCLCYLLRQKIPLHLSVFVSLVVISAAALSVDQTIFSWVYCAVLPYLVLGFAYLFAGKLRLYNKLGDYSYGVYIYAFPLQQTVIHLLPDSSVHHLFILASALTLLCAMFSWHVVEKPVMARRAQFLAFLRR
ncbi:acyltransferase [Undibacterium cyanobacteriorum]|uniref:Acyltransferase n=1 Tax=Undibacterium cyanobacteriorum TaxID=3073561 RepID=A0ABY9RHQ7_9BURK|nr:acyltransferase [Undibacterium sp. 20NA77.5]WMW80389.1 acyltransferase [Undibacterium sp. 20NA77.5]